MLRLEKILNRLLGVEKKKISETPGKNVDRWGRGIILIFFLSTLPFFIMGYVPLIKWYWIVICNYIIWFSVYSGVEIPEELKTIYYDTCFSDFNHNFSL